MGRRRRPKANSGDSVGKFAGDAWSLAVRAAKGVNEIRKLINIEYKILDTSVNSTAFTDTGSIVPLSTIVQGLDYNNRIGDSIKMQSIEFRCRVNVNASTTTTSIRVILFRDFDGYGTLPTVADIMEVSSGTASVRCPKKFLNKDRFTFLLDEYFTLSPASDYSTTVRYAMPHDGHIKYLGTTAANSSNGKGTLYALFLSDEATNTPTYALYNRIVFTDD